MDLGDLVYIIAQVLTFAIVARALLSWFPTSANNPLADFLQTVTEPIIAPLRRILPRVGFFDLSPIVAIIVLQLVGWMVQERL